MMKGQERTLKMKVGEGLKTFGAMKMMFKVRSVNLREKRELRKRVMVPTVLMQQKFGVQNR